MSGPNGEPPVPLGRGAEEEAEEDGGFGEAGNPREWQSWPEPPREEGQPGESARALLGADSVAALVPRLAFLLLLVPSAQQPCEVGPAGRVGLARPRGTPDTGVDSNAGLPDSSSALFLCGSSGGSWRRDIPAWRSFLATVLTFHRSISNSCMQKVGVSGRKIPPQPRSGLQLVCRKGPTVALSGRATCAVKCTSLSRTQTNPEYAAINSMLDQINSCLDHLEEKNDHLHAQLKELLESNRQTRLEFQQQLNDEEDSDDDGQGSEPET